MDILKWSTSVIQLSWSIQVIMCVSSASWSLQSIRTGAARGLQYESLGRTTSWRREPTHSKLEPRPRGWFTFWLGAAQARDRGHGSLRLCISTSPRTFSTSDSAGKLRWESSAWGSSDNVHVAVQHVVLVPMVRKLEAERAVF
jgi:hypothetical protein